MKLNREQELRLKEILSDPLFMAFVYERINSVIFSNIRNFPMHPDALRNGESEGVALRDSIISRTLLSFIDDLFNLEVFKDEPADSK